MDYVIKVSFKKSEKQLYDNILIECKVIGQSAWMKLAAIEKLDRDKLQDNNISPIPTIQNNISTNVIDTPPKQNNKLPIICELTELFNQ